MVVPLTTTKLGLASPEDGSTFRPLGRTLAPLVVFDAVDDAEEADVDVEDAAVVVDVVLESLMWFGRESPSGVRTGFPSLVLLVADVGRVDMSMFNENG